MQNVNIHVSYDLFSGRVLPSDCKKTRVESGCPDRGHRIIAAAEMGQSISDFAISTLVQAAGKILHDQQVTRVSERDRQHFVAILDDQSSKPNDALMTAAKRYKKQVG